MANRQRTRAAATPTISTSGAYGYEPIQITGPQRGFFENIKQAFKNIGGGTPSETTLLPIFGGQQNQALDQLLQQGLGRLPSPSQTDFGPIEDYYKQQFHSQTIPSLAERFTSMGGGQRSSAFQGALGAAGSQLNSRLAALKSQYGLQQNQQQYNQALPLIQAGLTPRYETLFSPRGANPVGSLLGNITGGQGNNGLEGLLKILPFII